MSKPKNETFLNILNEYLEKNTNKLSLKEILYKNVTKIKKNKCLILTENIKDGISYIYNNKNTAGGSYHRPVFQFSKPLFSNPFFPLHERWKPLGLACAWEQGTRTGR